MADGTQDNPLDFINETFSGLIDNKKGSEAAADINNNIAGNYSTGPVPSRSSNLDFINSFNTSFQNLDQWAVDPNKYGKPASFASGASGQEFERYYSHPNFKSLGYSPIRDNEGYYNANSTQWDDFKRAVGFFPAVFGAGFKSLYDFGSKETSKQYEENLSLGMTSKGGVGGFFTNLTLNAGFTLGIVSEMILENMAIAGLTALSPYLGATAAITSATKNAQRLKSIPQGLKSLEKTSDLVRELRDVNKANEVWKAGQTIDTGRSLLPFSNTTNYVKNLESGSKGFDTMTNFVKTRKAFGAFYRDLREINLVTSESLMEGNMSKQNFIKGEIDKYYEEHGRMPDEKKAKEINDRAENVKAAVSLANMPVIYLTNKLVFDDLLNGFKKPSVIADEMLNASKRSLTKKVAWKAGEDAFSYLEKSAKNRYKDILFKSPYFPWSKKYIAGNLSEGLQETFQEATSLAAEDFYSDPTAAGIYSTLASVGMGLEKQFSAQGLETFASGFLMGSMVQIAGSPMSAPMLYKKYLKKGDYEGQLAAQKNVEDNVAKAANYVLNNSNSSNFEELRDNTIRTHKLSRILGEAQNEGDQKKFQDAKDEEMLENLYTLAVTGKTEMVEEFINDLQGLSDVDLAQAFGARDSEGPQVREKLSSLKTRAREFQNRYNAFNDRFHNPFNPSAINKEKDPEGHREQIIYANGFELAKKDAVMYGALFDKNLERTKSLYAEVTTSNLSKDLDTPILTSVLDKDYAKGEIDVLRKEISALKSVELDRDETAIAEKEDRLEKLRDFNNVRTDFEDNLNKTRRLVAKNTQEAYTVTPGQILLFNDEMVQLHELNEDGMATIELLDGTMVTTERANLIPVINNTRQEKELGESTTKFYEAFKEFIKSSFKGNYLNEEDLDQSFIKVKDYYALQGETQRLSYAVNMLNDPQIFLQHAKRLSQLEQIKRDNLENYIRQSQQKLNDIYKSNYFYNILFDNKITIDPDDAYTVFKRGDIDGITFYDATTFQPIEESDKRYAIIKAEAAKYKEMLIKTSPEPKPSTPTPDVPPPGEVIVDDENIDFTPNKVPKGLEELANTKLFTEKWVLKDNTAYVSQDGELAKRVSYLKGPFKGENPDKRILRLAGERGETLDFGFRAIVDNQFKIELTDKGLPTKETYDLYKELITNHISKSEYEIKFNNKALEDSLSEFLYLKDLFEEEGYTLYSTIPVIAGFVHGERFAGTIDILAKNKDGEYFLLDLKTHLEHNGRRTKTGIKYYKEADTIQLNAYLELFQQMTGKDVKGIFIIPANVKHALNYGTVSHVELESVDEDSNQLDEYLIEISTKKTIEELVTKEVAKGKTSFVKKTAKQPVVKKPTKVKNEGTLIADLSKIKTIRELNKLEKEVSSNMGRFSRINGLTYSEITEALLDKREELETKPKTKKVTNAPVASTVTKVKSKKAVTAIKNRKEMVEKAEKIKKSGKEALNDLLDNISNIC